MPDRSDKFTYTDPSQIRIKPRPRPQAPGPSEAEPEERLLYVEGHEGARWLVNASGVAAEAVTYSSAAEYWYIPGPRDLVVSERPVCRVRDVPARTAVWLEDVDGTEEGRVSFRLEHAAWADGREDEARPLPRAGAVPDAQRVASPERVLRIVEPVRTEASRVVRDFFPEEEEE